MRPQAAGARGYRVVRPLLKHRRQIILLFLDMIGCLLALLAASFITYNQSYYASAEAGKAYWTSIAFVTVLATVIINNIFHLYDILWEHATINEILMTVYSSLVSNSLFFVIVLLFNDRMNIMPKMELAFLFCYTAYLFGSRSAFRLAAAVGAPRRRRMDAADRRILIVGAGTAGSMVLNEIIAHPDLGDAVALIDDDEAKQGSRIAGVRVEGTTKDIPGSAMRCASTRS